ncbi:MAG: hypothetical protein AB1646_20115 [Thermodesulfobacteriota bacterium]
MTPLPAMALVKKDLLGKLRSTWLFVVLVGVASVGMVSVWATWPVREDLLLPVFWVPDVLAEVSERLTVAVYGILLAACALVIPPIAPGAISLERKSETLDQLRLTLITHLGIAAGKLASIVGLFLLMALAMLPAIGCVLFLAGVDWVQLVWSFFLVVSCACSCAAVGIMCSAWFRRTLPSIVVSFLGTVMVPMGLIHILPGPYSPALSWGVDFLPVLCPVVGLLDFTRVSDRSLLLLPPAYQMLICVLCLVITVLRLRGESSRVRSVEKPPSAEMLEQRRRKFPYFLIDPKARRKPIEDRRNPMLVKELRWGLMSRATWGIRVFFASLVVSGWICLQYLFEGGYLAASQVAMAVWVQMPFILCIVPALLAGSFAKEAEQGNMDMLRMTLLTPGQIVWGKLLSGVIAVAPLLLGPMFASILVFTTWLLEPGVIVVLCMAWVTVVVCILLSLSFGVFSSMVIRRTGLSILLSYGISLMAFWGLSYMAYYGLSFLATMTATPMLGSINRQVVAVLSPVFAFSDGLHHVYRAAKGSAGYSMVPADWVAAMCAYALLALGLIRAATSYFAKYRMQDR